MKKPVAIVGLLVVNVFLIILMITQVLAATYIHLGLSGNISYNATEIGARILTLTQYTPGGDGSSSAQFVTLHGSGTVDANGIYNEHGDAMEYANILGEINQQFTQSADTMTIYVLVKNKGDRYIRPSITLTYDTQYLRATQNNYYFDISANRIDPIAKRAEVQTAAEMVSILNSSTKDNFPLNSYIDNQDVYMLQVTFAISSAPAVSFSSEFNLNIAFMADVQYDDDNSHLLSVCQPINQADPKWTKIGYNATLQAQSTQIEVNTFTALKDMYDNRDSLDNTSNIHNIDDYYQAIIYRDIDVVNIDIATGEVIGKLSDPAYPFEWYGGSIILPAGTTLASGRVLDTDTTFTVDCYTYYPTVYFRRWMAGDVQYITISDQDFLGATRVDAYYTATFESTIFNPDTTIATNNVGNIIPRSYSYWWTPLTHYSTNFLQTYYNFKTYSNTDPSIDLTFASRLACTQAQYLTWANNLTTAWQNYASTNPAIAPYTTRSVRGAQGENWHTFVNNILYIVKYADNNAKIQIGKGNDHTDSIYNVFDCTIDTPGGALVPGDGETNRYLSQTGGGVIGLKGEANTSAGESLTYNAVGMAYGYQMNQLYYTQTYLTHYGTDRNVILDGYIGSDGYTSIWCLGKCNTWGNVWSRIFGVALLYDTSTDQMWCYVNFETYDHNAGNYMTANYNTVSFEENETQLLNMNYVKLSYNVNTADSFPTYMGTSAITSNNGLQSLIGLFPAQDTLTNSNTKGLCTWAWTIKGDNGYYGLSYGGSTSSINIANIWYYDYEVAIDRAQSAYNLRILLF